jgi:phosphate transport system permease protein
MTLTAPHSAASNVPPEERPLPLRVKDTGADLVFRRVLAVCSAVVLLLLASITLFLIVKGWPALREGGFHFFTGNIWSPDNHEFGVAPLLLGSVAIAIVAVIIAVPVSLATALMINEYAPARLRPWLTSIVDVLATIPSIVYGFWGFEVLSNLQIAPARWIVHNFGFVPILRSPSPGFFNQSVFATAIVCSLTIIPVVTSVSREVMAQAPRDACEAALGLGGTRWGMLTDVVLPFSRTGIVGGVLLGIGRGLGETMIVVLVLSSAKKVTPDLLGPNGLGAIAKEITEGFSEGSPILKSALILAGLALFATTLAVNAIARLIVARTGVRSR